MKGTSESEDREKEINAEIRKLAGELGSLSEPNPGEDDGKPLPDWESYDTGQRLCYTPIQKSQRLPYVLIP